MKKLSLLLLYGCLCCTVNAQLTPTTGNILNYYANVSFSIPSKPDTVLKLFIGDDTLINNKNCKRFNSDFFPCYYDKTASFVYEQDSVVMFAISDSSSFDTLYDFTKKKNEYWDINIFEYKYFRVQVDSVYNSVIQGRNYKTFDVTYIIYNKDYYTKEITIFNRYCSKILEKFGDVKFYFNLLLIEADCMGYYESEGLLSFSSSTDSINFENFDRTCNTRVISSIVKKSNQSQAIEIYPNIASSKIYLKSELDLGNLSQAVILDLNGSKYLLPIKINEIDVSSLSSGLYFLKIDGQTYKFMKE